MSELTPVPTPFDYQDLDTETRQFVQQKADETHGLLKRTAEHVLNIGKNLKAVKEKLPHGQFLLWVETEFGMSRWTVRNFINVADKLEDKWRNFHHLPVSVLYELASPSTSEGILEQVQSGQTAPTADAIKEAREGERLAKAAERQARVENEHAQRQLSTVNKEVQKKQVIIDHLTQEITHLQEQMATQASPVVEIEEREEQVVPPEVKAHIENLEQRLQALTQQRDTLIQQVTQLGEEARIAAQKGDEGEQERRIRLNWYKVTSEFQSSVTKIFSKWPSPLDTLAFEADDWTRVSQTKEIARRFLEACTALTQTKVIDITASTKEEVR